jgi:hypothetical protein
VPARSRGKRRAGLGLATAWGTGLIQRPAHGGDWRLGGGSAGPESAAVGWSHQVLIGYHVSEINYFKILLLCKIM